MLEAVGRARPLDLALSCFAVLLVAAVAGAQDLEVVGLEPGVTAPPLSAGAASR